MHTLIITAHPSQYGFTHRIAKSFYEIRKKNKNTVDILNLYAPENALDFLAFEDVKKDFPMGEEIKRFQEKIQQADEIVFIFPMWNLTEPAILKNFFDRVFTAGFAFKYTKKGAQGLLIGKTAHVFTTCDAPKIFWHVLLNPLKKIWHFGRIHFCGMKMGKFIYFDKMRIRSDKEKEKFLKKVEKIAGK